MKRHVLIIELLLLLALLSASCSGDEPTVPGYLTADSAELTINIINSYPEDFHPEISRDIGEYYVKVKVVQFDDNNYKFNVLKKYKDIEWPLKIPIYNEIKIEGYRLTPYEVEILGPGPEVIICDENPEMSSDCPVHHHITYRPYYRHSPHMVVAGHNNIVEIEISYCALDYACFGSIDSCEIGSYEEEWLYRNSF